MIGPRAQQVKPVPPIGVPFAAIPLDVMRRTDLTPAAKLVFAALSNNARMRRGDSSAWTNSQVAEAVGMTSSGVRRPLDELEAAGLIRRTYGESERVRTATTITYGPPEVGAGASTRPSAPAPQHQPGCRPGAPGVGAPATTPLSAKNEEPKRTPNLALDSGGEDPGDRIATPEEAAAFFRALARGAKPEVPTLDRPSPAPPRTPTPPPACQSASPPAGEPSPGRLPSLARMAYNVAFSARAAAFRPLSPKKTPAQVIDDLRRASAAREREASRGVVRRLDDPRPVVGDLAFQDAANVLANRPVPTVGGD